MLSKGATMKLVYLASPYSDKSAKVRKQRAEDITRIAADLTAKYKHAMFLPITQSHAMKKYRPDLGTDFNAWKHIDLYMVAEKCDECWVVKMKNWDKSVGVLAEIECAKYIGKPVRYIHPKTLRKTKCA
jgi:hypothetical protein